MELINAVTSGQLEDIENLYMKSFPKEERKPFDYMVKKAENGQMEILAIHSEKGEFCGLVVTITGTEWVLLDYFAIEPAKQGNHIGSEILSLLNRRYEDRGIVFEIERTDVECDNLSQRLRRKKFYLRNGMKEMGINVVLFGVEMELFTNGKRIKFDEYYQLYKTVFGEKIAKKVQLAL